MFFLLSHLDTNSLTMSMRSFFFFLGFVFAFCCCIVFHNAYIEECNFILHIYLREEKLRSSDEVVTGIVGYISKAYLNVGLKKVHP